MKTLLATAATLALLAAPALAQTTPPRSTAPSATPQTGTMGSTDDKSMNKKAGLSRQDRGFVHDAAIGGMAEVEEGKIAQQQAQNSAVKDFAKKMVDDHSQASEKLKSLAQAKGVQIPADLDKSHKSDNDKLMKSKNFDRDYVRAQVKDHDKTVKLFEKEVKSGEDAELKRFATDTLPILQQHQKMAHDLDQQQRNASRQTSSLPRSDRGMSGSTTGPTTVPPATR
jgi:putative membrane protein